MSQIAWINRSCLNCASSQPRQPAVRSTSADAAINKIFAHARIDTLSS